jgi:hypothetical protein
MSSLRSGDNPAHQDSHGAAGDFAGEGDFFSFPDGGEEGFLSFPDGGTTF